MDPVRRALVVGLCILASVGASSAQSALPAAAPPSLSPAEMETFLLTARIVSRKKSSKGVTDTVRATLSDGRITHDAQIQTVDITKDVFEAGKKTKLNFKDTYRFNIGAYRLARLLGLENVPMSVKRSVDGKAAAMTWWIDDIQFDEERRLKQKNMLGPDPERTAKQMHVMHVFDELIQNVDRNKGNIQWTTDWTLWMIDHTRAFRLGNELLEPDELIRCDRALLDGMRRLTLERLTQALGDTMTNTEIQAVLVRRDAIVKHFEARIATRGEATVLFSM